MRVDATKLALLIPRLASSFEGEVIATVRAIRGVLAASGHDLHDLARVAERGNYPTERRDEPLITQLKELFLKRSLNDWEREFVQSLIKQAENKPGFRPSPKQQTVIDRLSARNG
jgi:hypothetical protein